MNDCVVHDSARKHFVKFYKSRCQKLKVSENQFNEMNDATSTSLCKNFRNSFYFCI